MKAAKINYTEQAINELGGKITLPEDILSNGGKVIPAGTYDIIKATAETVCLGYRYVFEDRTELEIYGHLMFRYDDENIEVWTRDYDKADVEAMNRAAASEIEDLVLPEWEAEEVQEAPKTKTAKAPVRKYAGTTHGKWYVDENTMTCHPKSGKAWKVLKVVRPGEEWIVTNGNKTGVLTQNRWDNIEK